MQRLTIFTWGYWGWGNATIQLVRAVDSVEASRCFQPPVFVDIRISRSVRAKGFNGKTFAELVGKARYIHLPALGNLAILGHPGLAIQIKDPSEVGGLLDLAQKAAEEDRRIVFFCSCEYPGLEGQEHACHRATVGGLLLRAAHQRQLPIEVIEWPGGASRSTDISLSASAAQKLLRGGKHVPLEQDLPGALFGSIPPGSVVRVHSTTGDFSVIVGGLRFGKNGWYLPALSGPAHGDEAASSLVSKAQHWRKVTGFEPRRN